MSRIHITAPQVEKHGDSRRVQATVNDQLLWFECSDIEIVAQPESFLTAFFIPALHLGARLSIDAPVDPGWIQRTQNLLPIYNQWWNYSLAHPLVNVDTDNSDLHSPKNQETSTNRKPGVCFTGGVDSFYELLEANHNARYLFFVHGFDIPLDETKRFEHFEKSLHGVAEKTAMTPVVVRTNMREHSIFQRASWERTHGAALASVGMLLNKKMNGLHIPSSYTREHTTPWGSHWKTDHMWSIPGRFTIIHGDASINKMGKIKAIATASLPRRHLRVCWQNFAETGNCSQCEKCLRTMVRLDIYGHLPEFYRVFNTQKPLSQLIEALDYIPHHLLFYWKKFINQPLSGDAKNAIEKLIKRSKREVLKNSVLRIFQPLKRAFQKVQKETRLLFSSTDKS